jgi:hypothetical protein
VMGFRIPGRPAGRPCRRPVPRAARPHRRGPTQGVPPVECRSPIRPIQRRHPLGT